MGIRRDPRSSCGTLREYVVLFLTTFVVLSDVVVDKGLFDRTRASMAEARYLASTASVDDPLSTGVLAAPNWASG